MATLEEIGTRLQGQGIGTVGTNIFLGRVPDAPDDVVGVLPTGGLEAIRTMGAPNLALRPSFQILARSKTVQAARDKVQASRTALHGFSGILTGGAQSASYLEIKALQSEGFPIAPDANGRHRWVCNFQAHKEPSV